MSASGYILELLGATDIVVGMSSVVLAEAHALGLRTMSILPREAEREWLSIIRESVIPCATKREVIGSELRRLLLEGARTTGRPACGRHLTRGLAVDRIMRFLSNLPHRIPSCEREIE